MALNDQTYQVRFPLPSLLERGIDTTIEAPVYQSGALVAPTSGTITIYDEDNDAKVSAAAVTITDSVATYTVTAGTTSGLTLADGWRVEWTLTVSGKTIRSVNEASLVRQIVRPMLSDVDIYRRVPALDPNSASVITSETNYQGYIDEANTEVQLRLIAAGRRPWLIMSPASLRPVYLNLSLAIIFEDLAARLANVDYMERADRYREAYAKAYADLNFTYDLDLDGIAETNESGNPARVGAHTIFLTGRD
jgi:SpoVK/Ycf46/Vps4 family AAA+-type ATPase